MEARLIVNGPELGNESSVNFFVGFRYTNGPQNMKKGSKMERKWKLWIACIEPVVFVASLNLQPTLQLTSDNEKGNVGIICCRVSHAHNSNANYLVVITRGNCVLVCGDRFWYS